MSHRKTHQVIKHDDDNLGGRPVGKPTTATQAVKQAQERRAGREFGSSDWYGVQQTRRRGER
ncbi:hypothetical protein [Catenuloplanes indicus]|uniref:Uncharacterized protein n=1 Tax=Catenuloplanes indicus TaxID=137267 RepID=A0AAE3W1G4_9ACTN|nr:hypothetical protein [Catenuloplanes indicus]MDQ0367973.1 hypothetical protein [Catenuloplanes indicus]